MMAGVRHEVLDPALDAGWDLWEAFLRTVPFGAFYASRGWLRAVSQGMGHKIAVHLLVREGQVLTGAVVRESSRLGITVARKPWATAYTGPFCHPEHAATADALVARMMRRYGHMRLVAPPRAPVPRWTPRGWTCIVRQTPLLALGDEDALWQSFDRRVRQRVRKAQHLGVMVRERSDAMDFHALYRETYASQGLPMPLTFEQVQGVLGAARATGSLRMFTAHTAAGEAAAGLVVGADARRAYFVLAGSHPVHRKTDAMSLLWWEVLRLYGSSHGEADLVGCGLPSVDRFKDAFCPQKVDHADVSGWAPGWGGWACRGALAVRRWLQAA